MSVLRTGRGRAGGGGGEVEFLTENFFSLRNVPGVLKRQKKNISDFFFPTFFPLFFGGGGGGVARGRKTIHFFL